MIDETTIQHFKESLRGQLIQSHDAMYDSARKLYNGSIDKKPQLIARCVNSADVINAVNFGRQNDLLIAIKGGGHNGAGLASCDDGLVIDLSLMKGVHIEPHSRRVRVESGCTNGDVDHATHAFGLGVPAGIVSTTGVAGLTLGGGHGYLSRKYGLTIDNLISADVVLADGSFVRASESKHPDLFWAMRGGGGNFGVVTSFEFNACPVKEVYGGPIFWDVADAKEVMQVYREFLPSAPQELSPFFGLKTVPSTAPFPDSIWGRKICAIISCYNGPAQEAETVLRPILKDLPKPIFEHVGMMPFTALQSMFDPLLPPGYYWYWRGDYVKELSDDAIEVHLEQAAKAPSELSLMHLYPIDGAVHDVGPKDTAFNYRNATWSMAIAGIDPSPAKFRANKDWVRNYWTAIHPYSMEGAYVNFMMEEGEDRIKATYGDNYQRLADIKTQYDPANLFRVNQNIRPQA